MTSVDLNGQSKAQPPPVPPDPPNKLTENTNLATNGNKYVPITTDNGRNPDNSNTTGNPNNTENSTSFENIESDAEQEKEETQSEEENNNEDVIEHSNGEDTMGKTKIQDNSGETRPTPTDNKKSIERPVSKPTFAATVGIKLAEAAKNIIPVDIKHGTHLGKPAVFFSAQDYFVNLAEQCKLTIVEKFVKTTPSMEEIRKAFATRYHLKEPVKVAYFNNRHVYLDFANEVDYNHILFKNYIHIGDSPMKVLKWSPDFKPEEETPIAHVWILIHQLPWHLFRWDVVSRMLSYVGTVVAPDMATMDGTEDGVWLKIEYEEAPEYCLYYKLQGHQEHACRNKARDEKSKAEILENKQKQEVKINEDGFTTVTRKGRGHHQKNETRNQHNIHTNQEGNNNTSDKQKAASKK
ncbi:hypothetical protein KY290_027288 [Solanum tuberosum]|uniref:DUF4283 domain-containing protein n=1 Tax=Solanum tuberosum TaxID=4113 RepID=A0ABQ7UGD0_SOLTU|nr:hypothetical protein KY290_027288 [Solanum tuberosum]